MKLMLLVLVLLVHNSTANLFMKCFTVYTKGSAKPQTIANHCSTIRNTSDCLDTCPDESSPIVDYMRFYILQHAMFDIDVQLCSAYNYTSLRNIVIKTELYKRFGQLFVDKFPSTDANDRRCALLVHLASKRYYAENNIVTPKQLLCDDARNLSRFYQKIAQKMKCKSKSLQNFGSTIWHVVPKLNNLILQRLKISC